MRDWREGSGGKGSGITDSLRALGAVGPAPISSSAAPGPGELEGRGGVEWSGGVESTIGAPLIVPLHAMEELKKRERT